MDKCSCSICGWEGDISNCMIEQDGNREEGFYDRYICPVCIDGGCIDNYFPSDGRVATNEEQDKAMNTLFICLEAPSNKEILKRLKER